MSNPPPPSTLVMSATISPPAAMPGSARNDPKQRLAEYEEAFRFYLGLPSEYVDSIAIFENSGADLGVFREIAASERTDKRIHLINTSPDYPAEKGKGYGEFLMMDRGLTALRDTGLAPGKRLWKVTGRLKIVNMKALIARAPADFDIYCDLRDVPFIGDALGGNRWMELRVFAFTLAGYDRYLLGNYDLGLGLETFLFEIVNRAVVTGGDPKIIPRFNLQPVIDGFCGYNNKSYLSFDYRLKNMVRRIGRVVAPNLWL